MTEQQRNEAWRYVLRIKNLDKREYGVRYLTSLLHHPDRDPDPIGISYMAAQAVRIRLHHICDPKEP